MTTRTTARSRMPARSTRNTPSWTLHSSLSSRRSAAVHRSELFICSKAEVKALAVRCFIRSVSMRPIIITTAITGAIPRKKDNPAVPVTPHEQIESTHAAYEAGSALVHIHVRDEHENPSSSPDLFAKVQDGVRKYCPGMI